MHYFFYRNGALFAEEVDLARIAEEVGTPFYCYSTATIERHFQQEARGPSVTSEGRNHNVRVKYVGLHKR